MHNAHSSNPEHHAAALARARAAGLRAVASLELAKGLIVLLLGFGASPWFIKTRGTWPKPH